MSRAASTIRVASRNDAQERLLIFPATLAEKRYVALTFYSSNPITIKDIKHESSKNGELSVRSYITSVAEATTKVVKSAVKIGGETVNAVEKLLDNNKGVTVTSAANATVGILKAASGAALTRSAVTDKDFEFGVYLPLTNQLRESMSQNYDKAEGLVAGKLSSLMDTINKASPASVQQLGNQFGSRTLLVNPDFVQNYKGPGMRELTMNWSLLPNNQQEAISIFKIIKQLKMASSPRVAKDVKSIMFSPMFCSVTFENVDLDEMVRFDEMVISNIAVNYSESGFMETFKDGIPKAINLSLTLLERRMKTANDWSDAEKTKKEFSDAGSASALTNRGTAASAAIGN